MYGTDDDWSAGYVTDVEYTHGFYGEMAPSRLALVLLARGCFPPDIGRPFKFCELGAGQGLSTNVLAAANPLGSFWANDFNPTHIANAKRLAAEGGLANVEFADTAFADLDKSDTPEFDFICLHGVYSWINAENRAAIIDFVRRKVKVGGVVFVSYNAYPGWAASMPLRELLCRYAESASGTRLAGIDAAIKFADRLKSLKVHYFQANEAVTKRLDHMAKQSRHYLAHEFFNRDWTPFYHSEVAGDLRRAKMTYVGSAHLPDDIDQVTLDPEQAAVLAEIPDPSDRETVKSFFLNQQFRRDVFVRGPLHLKPLEVGQYAGRVRLAPARLRADMALKAPSPRGEFTLKSEYYEPIFDRLDKGPVSIAEILADRAFAGAPAGVGLTAILVTIGLGYATNCLAAEGEAVRRKSTEAFNQAVLARARFGPEIGYLASPVTGSGVGVEHIDQLFMLARREQAPAIGQYVERALTQMGRRLAGEGGKPIEDPKAAVAELDRRAKVFEERRLPLMQKLGVVQ